MGCDHKVSDIAIAAVAEAKKLNIPVFAIKENEGNIPYDGSDAVFTVVKGYQDGTFAFKIGDSYLSRGYGELIWSYGCFLSRIRGFHY